MNKIHKKKLTIFFFFAMGLTIAFALIIFSLKQNLNVFVTPTDLATIDHNKRIFLRLGGMVKPGSVERDRHQKSMVFVMTDFKKEITVFYKGMLPDLFREGKGAIAEGQLSKEGHFIATTVLAKHDENYMPRSVYDRKKIA